MLSGVDKGVSLIRKVFTFLSINLGRGVVIHCAQTII